MGKKVLPYFEPIYRTYNHMACLGVCAQGDPQMNYWALNNYTSWVCSRNSFRQQKSPQIGIPYASIWRTPPFFYHWRTAKKYVNNCYAEVFKAFINDGYYVYFTNVDDYYIKMKSAYKRYHFPHDGVITGYDEDKKVFYISAYSKSGHFENMEIPTAEFGRAWHSKYNNDDPNDGTIVILKIVPDKGYTPDNNKMLNDIDEYVRSVVTPNSDSNDLVFGLKVYDELNAFFDAVVAGDCPCHDTRLLRIIYEHKLSMYRRLEYLCKESIVSPEIVDSYKMVLDTANKSCMLHLKYVITNNKGCLNKIQQNINIITDMETRLLSSVG